MTAPQWSLQLRPPWGQVRRSGPARSSSLNRDPTSEAAPQNAGPRQCQGQSRQQEPDSRAGSLTAQGSYVRGAAEVLRGRGARLGHCPEPWPSGRLLCRCGGGVSVSLSVSIPDEAEHPFITPLGTRSPAFTKHLFKSFALFFIGLSFSSFGMFWTLCVCCRYTTRIFYPW